MNEFLTANKAGREIGVSPVVIRAFVKQNDVKCFMSGNRVYINMADLREKMSSGAGVTWHG